jgi:hypothetical protein
MDMLESQKPPDEELEPGVWMPGAMVYSNEAVACLEARFGTVLQSLFTLYHMLLGDDLNFGIRLSAESEPIMWLVLICFSLFMTFAVLNLITGMIVECSFSASAKERDARVARAKKAEVQLVEVGLCHEIFKLADSDASGWLSPEQYKEAFRNETVKEKIIELGLDLRHAEDLSTMIDINNDGEISLRELTQGFLILRRCAQGDPQSIMHRDMLQCHDLVHRDVLAVQAQVDSVEDKIEAVAEVQAQQQTQMAQLIRMQEQQQAQMADLMRLQTELLSRK